MRVRLEATTTDPRIFEVLLDFSEYAYDCRYFPVMPLGWRRAAEIPVQKLDVLLFSLRLRRISWWKPEYSYTCYRRVNVYRTTVISDRELT